MVLVLAHVFTNSRTSRPGSMGIPHTPEFQILEVLQQIKTGVCRGTEFNNYMEINTSL
jgi:hypothetical protein